MTFKIQVLFPLQGSSFSPFEHLSPFSTGDSLGSIIVVCTGRANVDGTKNKMMVLKMMMMMLT